MVEPNLIGAKHIMRYLWVKISHGLRYTAGNVKLHDYSNADSTPSVEDHMNTSDCWFSLDSAMISWMIRKQNMVVLSTPKNFRAMKHSS